MRCIICEKPITSEDDIGMIALSPRGAKKIICTSDLQGMLNSLGIGAGEEGDCDHFHAEDAKEIASEVEEFFKR